MKIFCATLGCKVNSYDTENILAALSPLGGESTADIGEAEVVIVNTCAVTNEAERKSRQLIRRLAEKNDKALLIVTGCYGETKRSEIEAIENVFAVTGTSDRSEITRLVAEHFGLSAQTENAEFCAVTNFEEKTRAVVKVQDGCKMFCSYCVIPYARNRMLSAKADEVVAQIQRITASGYREVSLTGIHLASYHDGNTRLIDLIERIADETELPRLRLGSLEPRLLSTDFLSRLSRLDCFCPHFHISLQSGSTTVLERMNRRYTAEQYFEITQNVREYFPNAAITTDIIVGFPGESEEEFSATLAFAEKVGFAHIHVFPFSPKNGTPAAAMAGQITQAEKKNRAQRLIEKGEAVRERVLSGFVGAKQRVLIEKQNERGLWEGFSENYLRFEIEASDDLHNQIVEAKAISVRDNMLFSRI